MLYLLLVLLFCSLVSVEGFDVRVLPVSQALGGVHVFEVHTRTAMRALIALIATYYGVQESRVILFFGGRAVQDLRRVKDIPGFRDGYTLLMIVRDAAVQAVQAVEAVPREVFDAAK